MQFVTKALLQFEISITFSIIFKPSMTDSFAEEPKFKNPKTSLLGKWFKLSVNPFSKIFLDICYPFKTA
jgi:hypothetical protein